MNSEIYAILEVTQKDIRFAVGKYRNQLGLKVIFKEKIKGNWLTNEDEIIDVNVVSHRLKRMVSKFESIFNEKIINVGIIFPTKTLQIKNRNSAVQIQNEHRVVQEQDIKELYKLIRKMHFDDNQTIINVKPIEFIYDQMQRRAKIEPGIRATYVEMNCQVYSISKKVYNSFLEVLKLSNLQYHSGLNQLQALARQCNNVKDATENFVLISWDWDKIDISYFTRESLIKVDTIGYGLETIIKNLSIKMNCKLDVAEKYLFKLTDFVSLDNSNLVSYRKYISSKKVTYELKTNDIKEIVRTELNSVIDKADFLIERELGTFVKTANIYHVGKITEIAGFNTILFRSKFKMNSKIYYSLVPGATELWTAAICGMIKQCHITNKKAIEIKTSTKVITRQVENNKNQLNQNSINNYNPNSGFDPRMHNPNVPFNRANLQNSNQFINQNVMINTQRNKY